MIRILVLHGPNLNMLGLREEGIYGDQSLNEINTLLTLWAEKEGVQLEVKQSNHEGELVTWVQEARGQFDAIVVNPAAYTHTSVALRDAVLSAEVPTVEVHLSNIHKREEFRHQSYVSLRADGVIAGLGVRGYEFAVMKILEILKIK